MTVIASGNLLQGGGMFYQRAVVRVGGGRGGRVSEFKAWLR